MIIDSKVREIVFKERVVFVVGREIVEGDRLNIKVFLDLFYKELSDNWIIFKVLLYLFFKDFLFDIWIMCIFIIFVLELCDVVNLYFYLI